MGDDPGAMPPCTVSKQAHWGEGEGGGGGVSKEHGGPDSIGWSKHQESLDLDLLFNGTEKGETRIKVEERRFKCAGRGKIIAESQKGKR